MDYYDSDIALSTIRTTLQGKSRLEKLFILKNMLKDIDILRERDIIMYYVTVRPTELIIEKYLQGVLHGRIPINYNG